MLTIPSGDSRADGIAPPVLAVEFITTDLSAEHLTMALHYFRSKEYEMFRSNTVPYLVQANCARGILRAILAEYNDKNIYNDSPLMPFLTRTRIQKYKVSLI